MHGGVPGQLLAHMWLSSPFAVTTAFATAALFSLCLAELVGDGKGML